MPNPFSLFGRYRQPGGAEIDLPIGSAQDRSLLVAENKMRYAELTRKGQLWSTIATSAVAALVVRPSTVAAVEIWNGNQGGGPSLVVDRLFSEFLVSTAVTGGAGLWAQVTTPKAAPTSSLTVYGHTGKGYGGLVLGAVGTTVVANGWFPYGPLVPGPDAATPGGSWDAYLEGRLIVPPQCSLCIHVLASVVGFTFCSGASWAEEQIDLP